jgi:hypothetical protein
MTRNPNMVDPPDAGVEGVVIAISNLFNLRDVRPTRFYLHILHLSPEVDGCMNVVKICSMDGSVKGGRMRGEVSGDANEPFSIITYKSLFVYHRIFTIWIPSKIPNFSCQTGFSKSIL